MKKQHNENRRNFDMEAPPVLFHSPLYRSFIVVLGKLLYEYRPNDALFLYIIVIEDHTGNIRS